MDATLYVYSLYLLDKHMGSVDMLGSLSLGCPRPKPRALFLKLRKLQYNKRGIQNSEDILAGIFFS